MLNTTINETWFASPGETWWEPIVAAPQPTSRYGPTLSPLPGGEVLLSGGQQLQADDSNWLFTEATRLWTRLQGPQPPNRTTALTVVLSTGDALVTGAFGASGTLLDSWVFDHVLHTWSRVPMDLAQNRDSSSLVPISNGRALLFGGLRDSNTSSFFTTNLVLNSAHTTWSALAGTQPPVRYEMQTTGLSNGNALVFSGLVLGGPPLDDTWVFNASTDTWHAISAGTHPPGRYGSALRSLPGNRAVLYGGLGENDTVLTDMWIFDGMTETWSQVQAATPLPPQRIFSQFRTSPQGRMTVYGGYFDTSFQSEGILGDTWYLDLFGASSTAVGAVDLKQLGIGAANITSLSAKAAAGADGFSLDDSAALSGVDLQLYRVSNDGPAFQTCGTTAAPSTAPLAVNCAATPFAGSTRLGLRVKPIGFSNGKPVAMTVNSAELNVSYRSAP